MIIVACPCSQPGKVTQPHASPAKLPNPEHAGALPVLDLGMIGLFPKDSAA